MYIREGDLSWDNNIFQEIFLTAGLIAPKFVEPTHHDTCDMGQDVLVRSKLSTQCGQKQCVGLSLLGAVTYTQSQEETTRNTRPHTDAWGEIRVTHPRGYKATASSSVVCTPLCQHIRKNIHHACLPTKQARGAPSSCMTTAPEHRAGRTRQLIDSTPQHLFGRKNTEIPKQHL